MPSLSDRAIWAIQQMRFFQHQNELMRDAVVNRHRTVIEDIKQAYTKTNRETFDAIEEIANQRANADELRKSMIADERYFRSLTQLYADIAKVELAIDEQKSNSIRDASASRAE